jgi:prepilin-type N-terminal cleavage/methylation domain-containing protein
MNGKGRQMCKKKGCQFRSIAGMPKGSGMCPYHWAEDRWGKQWADQCYQRRGFTLIEMLVVIGVVVVLVSLLVGAGAKAVSTARDAQMALEVSQLAQAIETYKRTLGDYPPSFAELDVDDADQDGNRTESLYLVRPAASVLERHLRKCYPKCSDQDRTWLYSKLLDGSGMPALTGDEALVFWLALTINDERSPFTGASGQNRRHYSFDEDRLTDEDGDGFPTYTAKYAKDRSFVYFDSRTYKSHSPATHAVKEAQPYVQDQADKYVNERTFQVLCAGQDGEYGSPADQMDLATGAAISPKRFKTGVNYTDADGDNLANFSEGRNLADHIP